MSEEEEKPASTAGTLEDQIEDGSYYLAARRWYSDLFHSPIAERNYYIVVLVLAFITLYFATVSFISIFPINAGIPFTLYTDDGWENVTRLKRLTDNRLEDRNEAVMKFMISTYVTNRESYNLKQFEMHYRNIWSTSTSDVFNAYAHQVDPSNSSSPYHQYTDTARRDIYVDSIEFTRMPGKKGTAHAKVLFSDSVILLATNQEIRHAQWEANMDYQYTDFKVDQKLSVKSPIATLFGLTGDTLKDSGEALQITPMTFKVTGYKARELYQATKE